MNGLSVSNIKKQVLVNKEPVFLCRTICRGATKNDCRKGCFEERKEIGNCKIAEEGAV